MFTWIADVALRRARLMLVLGALTVVAMAAVGMGAFGKLQGGGFDDPNAASTHAESVIDEKFDGETNLVFLVQAAGGAPGASSPNSFNSSNTSNRADAPTVAERGRAIAAGLRGDPTVSQVRSSWDPGGAALTSKDGRKALVVAHVKGDDGERGDRADKLISEYGGDSGGVSVQAGGAAAASNDITGQVGKDLAIAEAIAIPVTLILLALVFGSFVAALLPLVVGLVAIVGTFAELFVLGSLTDVSVFSINLTTALGLGLGIDYALLLVSRFHEELAAGSQVPQALQRTVRTAGRTIVFSAATVVAALAALLMFPPFFLRSFAYAGIGVVVMAVLSALFVIPPLLAVLGHRVNKGRVPFTSAVHRADAPVWGKLAAVVMRRPAWTALPVLAVLLLAASPLLGVSFGTADERVLPESAQSRQVATQMQRDFPENDSDALQVITTAPVADGPLRAYAQQLSQLDGVVRVDTSAGSYRAGAAQGPTPGAKALARPDAQRLVVVTTYEPKSDSAQSLVREVRAVDAPSGSGVLVGGQDAQLVDSIHAISSRLPMAGGLIVLTTFVLLFLFTGSVVQPLRALALNAISLAAALGVMAWIFADGHASSLLGFTAQPLDTSMAVLLLCVAFGLSMDYEVFVTSRMKELRDAGVTGERVVTEGLARTGRIVTVAAGLLSVSFFAFGTSQISFLMMFGLGSGLAIVIDAVLVRGVLVPAAMRLLGGAAWYAPTVLRRLHARVGLSESDPRTATETETEAPTDDTACAPRVGARGRG
ncbi:MMPL family transporter [Streptomyces zagrosensis]|uniref:RND superfamily putative drug exporter n=1 Tax=Streptomyces zagrosensis TaxID=1042984 RepID=A0A7W9V188_9ACTN|nr:MMPL family transporter [Streptomyces zagrosensis]MBB5938702.1 RND superfamily putative drug exporter [Streptomyces zagrosensis]